VVQQKKKKSGLGEEEDDEEDDVEGLQVGWCLGVSVRKKVVGLLWGESGLMVIVCLGVL